MTVHRVPQAGMMVMALVTRSENEFASMSVVELRCLIFGSLRKARRGQDVAANLERVRLCRREVLRRVPRS
jgi:hypothetical protein